jgi:hypothetical protein
MQPFVEKNKILEVVTGSRAYGFATDDSDTDIRGITIPPMEYVIGLERFEQQQYPGEDKVIYGLEKFMRLAADCNPNIIELIFMPMKHVLFMDKWGELLTQNNMLFLSKKARHTFSGYAFSQLHRIKGHKRWLDNPPSPPNPADYMTTRYFVLIERDDQRMPTRVGEEMYEKYDSSCRWVETAVSDEYEIREKDYKAYCKWRSERNPARAELEEKYGYDCKHGTHLVRLLRMGVEILRDGVVIVDRVKAGDAEELWGIRNGAMKYEELIEYASKIDADMNKLYEISKLPHSPDRKRINELYMEIVGGKLGIK